VTPGSRLSTTRQGRVLTVELTNPPRNFFDQRMGEELEELVREVDRDPGIGAVILTGKDRFVTHYFVPELLRGSREAPFPLSYGVARAMGPAARALDGLGPVSRALRRTRLRDTLFTAGLYRTFRRMNASDKVYVAAINGIAFGMGAILALTCDLRLMADGDDYEIGLIETGVSMLAGVGGTQRLARMVGHSRAAELLLLGRRLSPAEAAEIGLVHRVAPEGELQGEALALAQRVAGRSPAVNREIKRMIYDAASRPFVHALRMEAAALVSTTATSRTARDLESYLRVLPERPTDREVLDAWDRILSA
jgi:enoyl-CoA hydratase